MFCPMMAARILLEREVSAGAFVFLFLLLWGLVGICIACEGGWGDNVLGRKGRVGGGDGRELGYIP